MPTIEMTDAAVKRLTAPPGQREDYRDALFPGLILRVTGAKDQRPDKRVWTFRYRFGGQQPQMELGHYPTLSLAGARGR